MFSGNFALTVLLLISFIFNENVVAPGAHKFKGRNDRELWALAQEEARLADILINGN
jgi:hypothetical protein